MTQQTPPNFPDGQYFQFTPVPPPAPKKAGASWLIPAAAGTVAAVVLILAFGMAKPQAASEKPPATPAPSDTPTPQAEATPALSAPAPSSEPTPQASPQAEQVLENPVPPTVSSGFSISPDSQRLQVARIQPPPGKGANFRTGAGMNSQIQAVIRAGELVEVTGNHTMQDGVRWAEIRYRDRLGWVAAEFLGGQGNAAF